jgi:hypothetical protein
VADGLNAEAVRVVMASTHARHRERERGCWSHDMPLLAILVGACALGYVLTRLEVTTFEHRL